MTAKFEKYLTECQHCLFFHQQWKERGPRLQGLPREESRLRWASDNCQKTTPLNYHIYSYQGIGWRSWKNPPVGPPSGRVANQTIVSVPCSTERDAAGPPMRVRTQPGSTAFTSTLDPRAASPTIRVRAWMAAFEPQQASANSPTTATCPP